MNRTRIKIFWIACTVIFASCSKTKEKSTEMVDFKRTSLSIVGEWEVTHAEVIYSNQEVRQEIINQVENTTNNYEYRFFKANKFERGQPETFRAGIEEMHGAYEIDSARKKILWYLEDKSGIAKDTASFDYIEINSNKMVMIEPYGTSIKVLKILNRKKLITKDK